MVLGGSIWGRLSLKGLNPCSMFGGRWRCAKAELWPVLPAERGCRQHSKAVVLRDRLFVFSARFPLPSQPANLPSCLRTWLPSALDQGVPAVRLL